MPELENEIEGAYAPTDILATPSQARKFNYSESFERQKFNGKAMQVVRDSKGKPMLDEEGNYKYDMLPTTELTPDYDFVVRNKLNLD